MSILVTAVIFKVLLEEDPVGGARQCPVPAGHPSALWKGLTWRVIQGSVLGLELMSGVQYREST